MIFGKKKRMIDVRDFQKRGIVRTKPVNRDVIPTGKDGFVDVRSKTITQSSKSNSDFFYGDKTLSAKTSTKQQFSSESEGYSKREVDAKMVDLDNKIYKLEQRMELLEKKLGVNQPSYPESNLVGW
jgi:hypothetical protein